MIQDASTAREVPRSGCNLHIGSGAKVIDGWVNLDINEHPGVDVVADVTEGLDFSDVRAVYAEHFLEHLPIDKALAFLQEVHRVLARGGWLRLSTPNLEWVWSTHYAIGAASEEKRLMTLGANRAFRGWGHQFLWTPTLLEDALVSCGFKKLRWCRYGESKQDVFRNLERHEESPDLPDVPHVIIVEAKKGSPQPKRLKRLDTFIREHFIDHLDW